MTEECLVVRCSGKPKDVKRVLGAVSDYAHEQFEVYTTDHGRPMLLVSWIEPVKRQEQLHMALAEILEWYDDLPNDTFEEMPSAIRRARRLIPERDK